MAKYADLTCCLPALEAASGEELECVIYEKLARAFDRSRILDKRFLVYLNTRGIDGKRLWCADVEHLDAETTENLLSFVMYSDHTKRGTLMKAFEEGYLQRILWRLAELDGTWTRPNVIAFHHEYDVDGYLSNWYAAPFLFGSHAFATSGHWLMWQKARVHRDWEKADEILNETDLDHVKWLGRHVENYDKTWEEVRIPLMRVGLRHKFVQNRRLANNLLSTGSAALAEAAPGDQTWGVGIGRGDPKLEDPANWYGDNLLGRTLMEVRADLRQLSVMDGRLEWPERCLHASQVWQMSLLELSRIPSTRPVALMYATVVAHNVPSFYGAKDVLRQMRASIAEIDNSMRFNRGDGLPITGWRELLDELALQVRLCRI